MSEERRAERVRENVVHVEVQLRLDADSVARISV
jgi:hypothetical protein